MRYLMLVPDGAADEPLGELNGRTPLEAARTPNLDQLARQGTVGMVQVTPPEMYPGSDAANMALLGYDPREYYTGRGPVEAAAMRIPLDPRDVAFRCSLIATDGVKLTDYSSGHIRTEDARPLIELAERKLGTRYLHLFPGIQYRHILVWNDGPTDVRTHAPHENMDRVLEEILPAGQDEGRLRQFIWDSYELLDPQPYNRRRRDAGLAPANMLWPWGQGRSPRMPAFSMKHGITGAVIAGVDVIRGLGQLTGLEIVDVPGATGYFDTDYSAKATHALAAFKKHPFVWVHVEAPDEAGHLGDIDEKIKAIETIDERIVGPVVAGLQKMDQCRILVVPDHATPVSTRGHKGVPVPYLLFDSERSRSNTVPYDERAAHERVPRIDEGFRLIDELLR